MYYNIIYLPLNSQNLQFNEPKIKDTYCNNITFTKLTKQQTKIIDCYYKYHPQSSVNREQTRPQVLSKFTVTFLSAVNT